MEEPDNNQPVDGPPTYRPHLLPGMRENGERLLSNIHLVHSAFEDLDERRANGEPLRDQRALNRVGRQVKNALSNIRSVLREVTEFDDQTLDRVFREGPELRLPEFYDRLTEKQQIEYLVWRFLETRAMLLGSRRDRGSLTSAQKRRIKDDMYAHLKWFLEFENESNNYMEYTPLRFLP